MILHIGFPGLLVIAFLQLKFLDVNIMEIQKDFREFFALLNAHKVHFIIVGVKLHIAVWPFVLAISGG
jgi:hypothetical protein